MRPADRPITNAPDGWGSSKPRTAGWLLLKLGAPPGADHGRGHVQHRAHSVERLLTAASGQHVMDGN